MDAASYVVDGRTMVPIRFIVQAMGANISWSRETRLVTILRDGYPPIHMAEGVPLPNNLGMIEIIDGRTFVPFRFVSLSLGAEVYWDRDAQAVYVFF